MKDDSSVCKGLKEDYLKNGEKMEILFSLLSAFMFLSDSGNLYLVAAVGYCNSSLIDRISKIGT